MQLHNPPPIHLTYCLNIHRGETWEENLAAIELSKRAGELSGWKRSSSGAEIDFIMKSQQVAVPVECKAALAVNKRHFRGLLNYLDLYGARRGVIVSFAPYSVADLGGGRAVVNVPAYAAERLADDKAFSARVAKSSDRPSVRQNREKSLWSMCFFQVLPD